MISLEECKKHIKNPNLSNQEIEEICGSLYKLANSIIDHLLDEE